MAIGLVSVEKLNSRFIESSLALSSLSQASTEKNRTLNNNFVFILIGLHAAIIWQLRMAKLKMIGKRTGVSLLANSVTNYGIPKGKSRGSSQKMKNGYAQSAGRSASKT
jgi:hypothetical protein